jgi:chromosome segregation ATPase
VCVFVCAPALPTQEKIATAQAEAAKAFAADKRALEVKLDEAIHAAAAHQAAADRLKQDLGSETAELTAEKERHKKSKAKFTESMSKAKAEQEALRQQIAATDDARAKASTEKGMLSAKASDLQLVIIDLQVSCTLRTAVTIATEEH